MKCLSYMSNNCLCSNPKQANTMAGQRMLALNYTGMIQVFCLEGNLAQQRINRNDQELILFIKDDDKYKGQDL